MILALHLKSKNLKICGRGVDARRKKRRIKEIERNRQRKRVKGRERDTRKEKESEEESEKLKKKSLQGVLILTSSFASISAAR